MTAVGAASTARSERITALGYRYGDQPKRAIANCNLCGVDRFVVIAHSDRYGYPAEASTCMTCGLSFLDPVMTPEAYARFYESVYRPLVSAYHGRTIDARTIQDEQRIYAEERAGFLAAFLQGREGASFLDVGGSTGIVAASLARRFGLRATVLDPAPLELAEATGLALETIPGFIEDYEPAGKRFDHVGMFQTVDHLLDVSRSLRVIRELISAKGYFYADIVDFRAAYLRNRSIEGAIKIDHPYYLTEPTFEAFLAQTGFEVIRKDYARDHLHIGYLCVPASPLPDRLPPGTWLFEQLREIRAVQNAG